MLRDLEVEKETMAQIEQAETLILGHLKELDSSVPIVELVPGIPMPAWYNPKLPTLDDINLVGLSMRSKVT